ncbi:TonB-dependent receptor [Gracilimonas sp. BCB1]|uniref:TonB-dependent receptor n=1 Tax=Gracilimonas sp. BCB1 TaxID=3152362 RepID=UPI0032D93A3F
MRFTSGILFFILFSLLSSPFLYAQPDSILRFIVQEESGQPIVSANVLLFEAEEEDYTDYGVTSRDGFVEFRGLKAGRYRIEISFVGFKTFEEFFEVEEGETAIHRISMEESIGELQELEVVEKGAKTGMAGITRIRAEDISRVPSASLEGDLMAYIETMPGVVSTGDQGGDLYIRGGTPSQNLVLVDNIPLVKPFHISNLFSAFPEKAVNNVSVMAGGFDNSYMNSTSAVIDVNLKTGNLQRFAGSASLSPYLSTVFIETPLQKGVSSLFVSGRASTINQFSGYLGSDEKDMQFYDIISRYTLQGKKFNCSLSAIYTEDEGRINTRRNTRLGWTNTGAGIRCFGFDEMFAHPFEVSLGYSGFSNTEGNESGIERNSRVDQGYLRVDMQEEVANLTFDYGVNVWYQSFSGQANELFTSFDEGIEGISAIIQLYLKTKWQVTPRLILEPGAGTQITLNYSSGLEPRLRVQYNPFNNNRTEFSIATGLYSQTLEGITDPRDAGSTFTLYSPTGYNDPLQKAFHSIFSWRNRFGRNWTTNMEVYYKKHTNIPVPRWSQTVGLETETVRAEGNTYGADFRLEYSNGPIFWYVGYGFGEVEYTAQGADLERWLGEELQSYNPGHDQRHKVNTLINYKFKGFDLSFNWEFGSGFPYTQIYATDLRLDVPYDDPTKTPGLGAAYYDKPYGKRLPVYHRLDVSLKKYFDLSPSVRLGSEIGAINAYDQDNIFYVDIVEYEVVNQTGVLPYLSLSVNFN